MAAMKAFASVKIYASKEEIWAMVTDPTKWTENIRAILKVEVIEEGHDFLGFKWKETREMFGKEANETMVVTDLKENEMYKTRAESHGSVYITTVSIEEKEDYCILSQSFEGMPQKLMAKVMMKLMGNSIKKSTEKALKEDLLDIKTYVENHSS